MAVQTPTPPGPPPRGFRWPDLEATWPVGPLGQQQQPPPRQPEPSGRHAVTIFVAIVSLLVGLGIGFQLGRDSAADDEQGQADVAAPATTSPSPATPAPAPSPSTPPSTGPRGAGPLGTLESPIPVGQAWILGIWQLEVLSVDFEADKTMLDESESNLVPDADEHDALVEIQLTLTDADVFVFAEDFQPWLVDDDGTEYDIAGSSCGPVVPDNFYENGLLVEGEPVSGNICWQIPAAVADKVFLGSDGIGGETTYFALR